MPIILDNHSLLDYFPGVENKDLLLFHHCDVPGNFTVFDPYTFSNPMGSTKLVPTSNVT